MEAEPWGPVAAPRQPSAYLWGFSSLPLSPRCFTIL